MIKHAKNKMVEESENKEASASLQSFTFPANPPIVIQARTIEEAEEEYNRIINNK